MAIIRKSIKGSGTVKLKSTVTSQEGTVVTTVETYTGPYDALVAQQAAVIATAKATSLTPTEAGEGKLDITTEIENEGFSMESKRSVSVEVIWQELRQPIETHKIFKDIAAKRKAEIKKMVDDAKAEHPTEKLEKLLYNYLANGTTEWVTGVPVVRRTTTKAFASSKTMRSGSAWVRGAPPISVPGFEFMKTADERHKEKGSYTQIEEWTGAWMWDPNLYPK